MSLSKTIGKYKVAICLFAALLFVTACSIQRKNSSSQQSNPDKQVNNIEKQQSISIRESSPKPPAAIQPEPSREIAKSEQTKGIEKKLGITIREDDPNMLLYIEAAKWVGTRYKYSGTGESGVDCSGLTNQIYKAVYKKTLNRSSADIARYNVTDIDKSLLEPGDLIFFATLGNAKAITHVGVYLKDNRFIHASSKVGVVVNDLSQDYYRRTFVKCGRVD